MGAKNRPPNRLSFFVSFCPPYMVQSLFKQPRNPTSPHFVGWKILSTGRGPQQTTQNYSTPDTFIYFLSHFVSRPFVYRTQYILHRKVIKSLNRFTNVLRRQRYNVLLAGGKCWRGSCRMVLHTTTRTHALIYSICIEPSSGFFFHLATFCALGQ